MAAENVVLKQQLHSTNQWLTTLKMMWNSYA